MTRRLHRQKPRTHLRRFGGQLVSCSDPDSHISVLTDEKKQAVWDAVQQHQQHRRDQKKMKKNEVVQKRVTALTLASDIDELSKAAADTFLAAKSGSMADTIALAIATTEIEKALTDEIMRPLMSLQGKAIGFKTDKVYGIGIVKEATVEAMLMGLPMAGNCINIIAKRAYPTKEGFSYLIDVMQAAKAVEYFKFDIGIPFDHTVRGQSSAGNDIIIAKVTATASWRQNGSKQEMSSTFPCKGDKWSSEDSYQGKAERKLKRRCYERMKGISFAIDEDIGDADDELAYFEQADVQEEPTPAESETVNNAPDAEQPLDSQTVDSGQPPKKGTKPAAAAKETQPAAEEQPPEMEEEERVMLLNRDLAKIRREQPKHFATVCQVLNVIPTKINHLDVEQMHTLLEELNLEPAAE